MVEILSGLISAISKAVIEIALAVVVISICSRVVDCIKKGTLAETINDFITVVFEGKGR